MIVSISVSCLHRLIFFFLNLLQFFYYHEKPFPPDRGQFKGHAVWSGNVLKSDGSIKLNNVQYSFNGTYTCQVRNPPDVHGFTSEIRLEVVQSGETRCRDRYRYSVGFLLASPWSGRCENEGLFLSCWVPVTVFLTIKYADSSWGSNRLNSSDTGIIYSAPLHLQMNALYSSYILIFFHSKIIVNINIFKKWRKKFPFSFHNEIMTS